MTKLRVKKYKRIDKTLLFLSHLKINELLANQIDKQTNLPNTIALKKSDPYKTYSLGCLLDYYKTNSNWNLKYKSSCMNKVQRRVHSQGPITCVQRWQPPSIYWPDPAQSITGQLFDPRRGSPCRDHYLKYRWECFLFDNRGSDWGLSTIAGFFW